MPGIVAAVTARIATLQVEREAQHAVIAPRGHGGGEFTGIALGIPLACVRIRPLRARFGIQVVERGLHRANVEQQSFDGVAVPLSALVGWLAVDEELRALDRDVRFTHLRFGSQCAGKV